MQVRTYFGGTKSQTPKTYKPQESKNNMEKKKFSYDEYSDNLIVSVREEGEVVRENFEVGDIVFSLTGKGKIVGIEIKGVSGFLESCNVNPKILDKIKNVELRIIPKKETIFLVLKIETIEGSQIVSKDIPLVMPLISR